MLSIPQVLYQGAGNPRFNDGETGKLQIFSRLVGIICAVLSPRWLGVVAIDALYFEDSFSLDQLRKVQLIFGIAIDVKSDSVVTGYAAVWMVTRSIRDHGKNRCGFPSPSAVDCEDIYSCHFEGE